MLWKTTLLLCTMAIMGAVPAAATPLPFQVGANINFGGGVPAPISAPKDSNFFDFMDLKTSVIDNVTQCSFFGACDNASAEFINFGLGPTMKTYAEAFGNTKAQASIVIDDQINITAQTDLLFRFKWDGTIVRRAGGNGGGSGQMRMSLADPTTNTLVALLSEDAIDCGVCSGTNLGDGPFSFDPQTVVHAQAGDVYHFLASLNINAIGASGEHAIFDSSSTLNFSIDSTTPNAYTTASGASYVDTADVPAVPEPTSLLLLGTGIGGLVRWRKRTHNTT